MREAARDELVPPIERDLDCRGDRGRALGIGAHSGVAAGLVHRLVRRADDRRAARHRLDHRQPEALEARRVGEHRGAAVQARQLVVVHVAEPDDARPVERRLLAPTFRADDRQPEVVAGEQRVCLDERREVLARLERRHGEDVVAAELGLRAVAREDVVDSGQRHPHAILGHAEQLDDVARGERRVREDEVARARRVPVLRRVHAARAALHPLRMAQRHEVVDRRRADPSALRRIHPVREVEHVDRAEEALDARPAEPAPALAPEVREGEELERELDGDALERGGDRLLPLRARGREGDDLVLAGGCLGETRQRPAEVRADPRPRMRERRDVEGDPHGS